MLVQLDGLMTEQEVANLLRVSTRCLREWRKNGLRGVKLKPKMLGKLVRYEKQEVQLFIERTQPQPTS